jgi:hypothetical protein
MPEGACSGVMTVPDVGGGRSYRSSSASLKKILVRNIRRQPYEKCKATNGRYANRD